MAFVKLCQNGTLLSQASKGKLCSGRNSFKGSHHVLSFRYCSQVFKRKWMEVSAVSSSLSSSCGFPLLTKQQSTRVSSLLLVQKNRSISVQMPSPVPGSVFRHDENLNAVRLLKSLPDYKNLMFQTEEFEESHLQIQPPSQTESASSSTVRKFDAAGLRDSVAAFIETAFLSFETKLPVTHPKNQEVVKKLLKEVSQLTDDEICQVLYHMRLFAPCPSYRDPVYMSVWKELDKECNARRTTWSLDFCFVVADLWYGMNLARYSEFHWSLIKRLFRKCDKLSKEHFVRFMFCLNLNRDMPDNINAYDLEYSVNKICDQLSPEEVVIIGMAFFKTQTPIRDPDLLKKLLLVFMTSSDSMDSVSVSGISKLARFSSDYRASQIILDFQEKFIPELPRLSVTACTHLSLTGTNCLSPHKELVQLVVNRIQKDVTEARLKELERISLSMTMFNIDCDDLAKQIAEELQSPERADEIRKYGRCLPSILHYLSIRNIFMPDLISMCLSKAFRDTYYGKGKEIYQRELLCLDVAADLEMEDYNGKRLEQKSFNFIMKKNMLRIRPQKVKVSSYEKFLRGATETFQTIIKDPQLCHVCAILPHHHTIAILYCRDQDGKFIKIPQYLVELDPHEIKKIQTHQNISYHAILLCGRNMYLFNSKELCGQANLQLRQIQKLGYKTHLLYYCDWENLKDAEQRIKHINSVVNDSSV